MLERFRMQDCNEVSTPADPNVKLDADPTEVQDMSKIPYKEAVGGLLYLSQISRPDIAFAVNQASRFCNNPEI